MSGSRVPKSATVGSVGEVKLCAKVDLTLLAFGGRRVSIFAAALAVAFQPA
jgi:hypothetical protein